MNQLVKKNTEIMQAQKSETKKYLSFLLGERAYAINILKIKELIEYGEITPIPRMPEFILGAINLRGSLVPVIDLMNRLGQEQGHINKRSCVVIVELSMNNAALCVGLMVDAVSRVIDFNTTDIEDAPNFGGNIDVDFIEGMGKSEEDFIIILDIDRILTLDDLNKLDNTISSDLDEKETVEMDMAAGSE